MLFLNYYDISISLELDINFVQMEYFFHYTSSFNARSIAASRTLGVPGSAPSTGYITRDVYTSGRRAREALAICNSPINGFVVFIYDPSVGAFDQPVSGPSRVQKKSAMVLWKNYLAEVGSGEFQHPRLQQARLSRAGFLQIDSYLNRNFSFTELRNLPMLIETFN